MSFSSVLIPCEVTHDEQGTCVILIVWFFAIIVSCAESRLNKK
jgi:hypothetical protein